MAFYTGHETLYDYLVQNIPDGEHTFQTVANSESVDLQIEFYNFYDDVSYTVNPILGNDVADERTLVLKYWGDLYIDQFVTMTPQVSKRGMVIYVMGNILNRGIISMTGKGANSVKAPGQDVVLWKNADGTFEYIPSTGAVGGVGVPRSGNSSTRIIHGNKGESGTNRRLGGGGAGGYYCYDVVASSGSGGVATSYSGGGGGGGIVARIDANPRQATDATGTIAGNGYRNNASNYMVVPAIGNPNGTGNTSITAKGTGGLLVIYCDRDINIDFNSKVESNGVGSSGYPTTTYTVEGGASGGGSVNIFHKGSMTVNGTISARGGVNDRRTVAYGGNGGDGTVTTMQVTFLQNRIRFYNDQHKPITAMDMGYAIQGANSPISKFTAESMYLVPIKNLTIGWEIAPDSLSDEAVLEFSKTLDPFVPENPIVFEQVLEYRQGVEMYVRARSGEIQVDQSKFAITASIEGA